MKCVASESETQAAGGLETHSKDTRHVLVDFCTNGATELTSENCCSTTAVETNAEVVSQSVASLGTSRFLLRFDDL